MKSHRDMGAIETKFCNGNNIKNQIEEAVMKL